MLAGGGIELGKSIEKILGPE